MSIICKARVKKKAQEEKLPEEVQEATQVDTYSKNERSNANIVEGGTKLRSVVSKI